jgi:hypothetical protein
MTFHVLKRMSKIALCASIFLCALTFISEVSAHQIKSDGSISILQHSDPNDNPLAGTTTTLYLNFTDTENKFSASECACVVYIAPYAELDSITETGDVFNFARGDLMHSYNENYLFEYIFPKRDIYAIVVEGTPLEGASFTPFRIVFDLRVADIAPGTEELVATLPSQEEVRELGYLNIILTTGVLFLILIFGILVQKRFRIKK